MANILITGGSGLVGKALTQLLLQDGHKISHLSTRKNYQAEGVSSYHWNVSKMEIERGALIDVDVIVHLAGASVAGSKWTDKRKKEIYDSRINSTQLLLSEVKKNQIPLKAFVSASAIGIYKEDDQLISENGQLGNDFLAMVCKDWEQEVLKFEAINCRTVILRTGIVLSVNGGAYKEMAMTLPAFVGSLGNGKQMYSWLHIDDMARMYQFAVNNAQVSGIYNAVAPNPVSQKTIAGEMVKGKLSPVIPTPAFALKLILGEMAKIVLASNNCSSKKIEEAGFTFKYPSIASAIEELRN